MCLNNLDWEAVGALATAAGTLVALGASWVAVRAPQKERERDRSEATHEVIRAAARAYELFTKAKSLGVDPKSVDELYRLAAGAGLEKDSLERLLDRPSLTDGAIVVGAGAMQLMTAILNQRATILQPSSGGLARYVRNEVADFEPIAREISDRARLVASYALRNSASGSKRKLFLKVAKSGLGN